MNISFALYRSSLGSSMFGHLTWTADSLEKTLMLGKIEGRRQRGWQRMRWLDGITNSTHINWANSGKWWGTGKPGMLQSMGPQSWTQNVWSQVLTCVFPEVFSSFCTACSWPWLQSRPVVFCRGYSSTGHVQACRNWLDLLLRVLTPPQTPLASGKGGIRVGEEETGYSQR